MVTIIHALKTSRLTRMLLLPLFLAPVGSTLAEEDAGKAGSSTGTGIEEIVVSATFRDTKLMDTPISISALDETALQNKGYVNMRDLYLSLPSVSYKSNASTYNNISIRGLTSPQSGGSTIGVYVDNIPVTESRTGGRQSSGLGFDLARVEALKGAQGTLYGEGSLGGLIRYISNDANPNEFDLVVNGTLESNQKSDDLSNRTSLVVNIPLIQDILGVRLGGFFHDTAGFLDTDPPRDQKDVNSSESSGGRIKINWLATSWLQVEASYNYSDHQAKGPSLAHYPFGTDLLTDPNFPNTSGDSEEQSNLTFEFELPGVNVTSSFSHFTRETFLFEQTAPRFANASQHLFNCVAADQGRLEPAIFNPFAAFGVGDVTFCAFFVPVAFSPYPIDAVATSYGATTLLNQEISRNVLEIRALSSDMDSAWRWTAGIFAKEGTEINGKDTPDSVGLEPGLRPEFEDLRDDVVAFWHSIGFFGVATLFELDELAVYGELTYRLTDQIDLTGGLRVARTTKRTGARAELKTTEVEDELVSPKLSISWRPNDGTLVYGTVTQGFRPGFFNTGVVTQIQRVQTALDSGAPFTGLVPFAVQPAGDRNGDGVVDGVDAQQFLDAYQPLVTQEGDEVLAYEIGLKTRLFNDRVTLVGALFYSDWKNTYLNLQEPELAAGGFGQFNYTRSAGNAHNTGLELDTVFRVSDNLTLSLGGDYLRDAELDTVPANTWNAVTNTPVLPGNRLPNAPKYKVIASLAYDMALPRGMNGTALFDYYRIPSSFNGVTNEVETPGYYMLNARFTAYTADGDWRFSLFGKNLTNEVIEFESNESGIGYGHPRTIGVEFTWNKPQ